MNRSTLIINTKKSLKFKLLFSALFIATLVFQLLANGLVFADELPNNKTENQFTVTVVGQGKPVILIPGLMSDARVWKSLSMELSNHYQLHLVNIAGFADTPASIKPSLLAVKQQLLSYIEKNRLTKPAIIGHSLGGFMAMWLASNSPDAVGAVISIDGLPYIGPVFTQTNDSTVESLAVQAIQVNTMYQSMTQQQLSMQSRYGLSRQTTSVEAQNTVMAMIDHSDPATVGEAIFTLLSTDLRQDISKITVPLLLLGASGGFADSAQQQAAAELYQQQLAALPQARLKMNTQSRHFIMLDDPQWLNTQVSEFLDASL
jgi:pimeloyl-ACP methyl ester carboxylesterase